MPLLDEMKSLSGLFGDAVEQLGKLVQNEVELARAELSEKASQLIVGVGLVLGAGIVMIPVLVLLLMALAAFLVANGFSSPSAYLIAAGAGAVLSVVLAFVGARYLKPDNLKLKVTAQQVSQDVRMAKEIVR